VRTLSRLLALAGSALLVTLACRTESELPPPSILLVVVDTLRADAVSAYGETTGTTPAIDALAAAGHRYTRAYAPSPWTLPSHASLLSGIGIGAHGVGLGGRVVLPEEVETLAERLRAAGYQTAAFSENGLVSGDFGFGQGFDHFSVRTAAEQFAAGKKLVIDVADEVAKWLDQRDPERPFFIFINLYDPHEPYEVRSQNPFLPGQTTTEDAKRLGAGGRTSHLICDRIPQAGELALLRGLYLGDVAAADAKLGSVLDLVEARGIENLVTVVTSDHGEHFGEKRLLDHEFSVQEAVLRVPLVVRAPGLSPAVVNKPVELRDVSLSLLEWAGADTSELAEGGLERTRPASATSLFAVYSDTRRHLPDSMDSDTAVQMQDFKRQACRESDRVFGDMLAVTRYPFRVNWYERYPNERLDLRKPGSVPAEIRERDNETFAALEDEARRFVERFGLGASNPDVRISPDNESALRSLGYID